MLRRIAIAAATQAPRRALHTSAPMRQNPTSRWNGPSFNMDSVFRMKKRLSLEARKKMLAAQQEARKIISEAAKKESESAAQTVAPAAPPAPKLIEKKPKEKQIKKLQLDPETPVSPDVPREEIEERLVSNASRLFDRRIKKKLNRGELSEAVIALQTIRAKGGLPSTKSYLSIIEALVSADHRAEAQQVKSFMREDGIELSEEEQAKLKALLPPKKKKVVVAAKHLKKKKKIGKKVTTSATKLKKAKKAKKTPAENVDE